MPNQNYRREADALGQFGQFGGRFVAESLMPLVLQLEQAYNEARAEPAFIAELDRFNAEFIGRPSPLYFAERLTEQYGGAKIFFKREELNHTGALSGTIRYTFNGSVQVEDQNSSR